ncbi:MAG: methane monooxygenase/ammonia monooxygenase subunit C [Gammaproteobacteria bacterium]|nr:methane monooxygenase/ammonia monooxygenase subunit C [Gammaproteobacteria bacterium]
MAVIAENQRVVEAIADGRTDAPSYPWRLVFVLTIAALSLFGLMRWYQNEFSFTVGLDYFDPDFQKYWMSLFWAQLGVIGTVTAVLVPYTWFTRDKDLNITPQEELSRYYMILAILTIGGLVLYFALNVFTEADAAWHQVTVRDTDFTPTHIFLFYGILPLMFAGIMFAFVWIHTRMPDFKGRVSIPLAVLAGGPLLIAPNLGYNEWGHTFFYAEELFGAPIHWGFVTLGWGFFGVAGFTTQCFNRMAKLTTIVGDEAEAGIKTIS